MKIGRGDNGVYSCKSALNGEWSNLTLSVLQDDRPSSTMFDQDSPERMTNYPKAMEAYSQIAENRNLDDDETVLTEKSTERVKTANTTKDCNICFTKKESMVRIIARPSGNMVQLKCQAHGKPEPNITWTRNSSEIVRQTGSVKMHKWSLTLQDLIPSDSGLYDCLICNIHGCLNWTTKLEVQGESPTHTHIHYSVITN